MHTTCPAGLRGIRRGETVSTFASSDHIQLPPLNIGEVLDVEIKAFYDSISSLPY